MLTVFMGVCSRVPDVHMGVCVFRKALSLMHQIYSIQRNVSVLSLRCACVCVLVVISVNPLWTSMSLLILGGECCYKAALIWISLERKPHTVGIQVGEISDVSILGDDKVNVIAYWSPLGNSHFHGSRGLACWGFSFWKSGCCFTHN